MMTKGHGFKPADLMGVANYWVPLKDVERLLKILLDVMLLMRFELVENLKR